MADRRCGTCVYFEPARDKAGRAMAWKSGVCKVAAEFIEELKRRKPASVSGSGVANFMCAWHGIDCARWQGGRERIVGKAVEP